MGTWAWVLNFFDFQDDVKPFLQQVDFPVLISFVVVLVLKRKEKRK